jgi:hypothetical protein
MVVPVAVELAVRACDCHGRPWPAPRATVHSTSVPAKIVEQLSRGRSLDEDREPYHVRVEPPFPHGSGRLASGAAHCRVGRTAGASTDARAVTALGRKQSPRHRCGRVNANGAKQSRRHKGASLSLRTASRSAGRLRSSGAKPWGGRCRVLGNYRPPRAGHQSSGSSATCSGRSSVCSPRTGGGSAGGRRASARPASSQSRQVKAVWALPGNSNCAGS